MAKSDIGPFGVLTLVLVLLAQVAALSATLAEGAALGAALAASALIVSRTSLTLACRSRVPAARPGGLGATVAGTVPGGLAALVAVVAVAVAGALAAVGSLAASSSPGAAISPAAAVALAFSIAAVAGLAAGLGLTRRCVRRLGGITGDTLGAAVETTMTVTLVVGAACLAAVL